MRPGKLRLSVLSLAVLATVGLIVLSWRSLSPRRAGNSISESLADVRVAPESLFPGCGSFHPVDLQPALVCDFYEHGLEHAPPRDPSGVMQKRERFYRSPMPPLDIIRSAPNGMAKDELASHLRNWQEMRRRGEPIPDSEVQACEKLADQAKIEALQFIDLGRSFDFLDGDSIASSWFRASLLKANKEFEHTEAGDPDVLPFLHSLDQTKALWRLRDYRTMERRFAIAARLYPKLSTEARRSAYLHADMLFYEMRYKEAADEILAVRDQDERVGDLGALERSDISEMEWTEGLFCRMADRHEEAIKHLRLCIRAGGEHAGQAYVECFMSLVELDRVPEAQKEFQDYVRLYHPTRQRVESMESLLESQRATIPPESLAE